MKSFLITKAAITSLIFISAVDVMAQTTERYEPVRTYRVMGVSKIDGKYKEILMFNPRMGYAQLGEDLVIKMLECNANNSNYMQGILVNKGADPIAGKIRIKIFDEDGDVIWQGLEEIKVGANNGSKYSTRIGVGTCLKPYRIVMSVE